MLTIMTLKIDIASWMAPWQNGTYKNKHTENTQNTKTQHTFRKIFVFASLLTARLKTCKHALPGGVSPLAPPTMHHPAAPPSTASTTTALWNIVDTRRCQCLVCPEMVASQTQGFYGKSYTEMISVDSACLYMWSNCKCSKYFQSANVKYNGCAKLN